MANTAILIKRSTNQAKPSSLLAGELGYSYLSNTIFIGTPDGNGVINIGGVYYTSQIDNATNLATAGALVKRDGSGNASFNTVYGSLGTASGVSAGSYGSTTEIPVVTVAANGIVTNVTTASISTSFNIAGDTGTGTVAGGETLTVAGRDGISTVAVDANNTVLIDVDNTVIRTTGGQTIGGDLSITGNLNVTGTQTFIDSETVRVNDSLIKLANNNTSDIVDIGFYGQYYSSIDGTLYSGLVREGENGTNAGAFYLFSGLDTEPTGNTVNYSGLTKADLYANLKGGTVSALASAIGISDGGTNATSFTTNQRLYYNGTRFVSLANNTTTVTGGLSTSNTITSITVDDYGQITAYTGAQIAISADQITSGTLGVGRGGTGATSFTTNGILYGNSTGALQITAAAGTSDQGWSNQILTTTNAGTPVWTTTLDGGSF